MLPFLIICAVAAVNAQHNDINMNDLRRYMDISFARYDHDPNDGLVLENEWDATIYREDANNDTCVTLTEYLSVHSCPVANLLYAHYDHNNDQCLKIADMSEEFHLIDHSGDNVVTLHEWEQYFQHLYQKMFVTGGSV